MTIHDKQTEDSAKTDKHSYYKQTDYKIPYFFLGGDVWINIRSQNLKVKI